MKFIPYLNFDGDCAEAFSFYAKTFGAELKEQYTYAGMPDEPGMPPLSEEDRKMIMHAELRLGEQVLYGSDTLPDFCDGVPYQQPQSMWVSVLVKDFAEGERVFAALAEGGTVSMPFEKTFFAEGYGQVRDRFGVPWMVMV